MSNRIFRATSHRSNEQLKAIPGSFGPYWAPSLTDRRAGRKPSIFTRADGQFWIIPESQDERAHRIRGAHESRTLDENDLQRFWGSRFCQYDGAPV